MAISSEQRDQIRMILSGQKENPVSITTSENIDWHGADTTGDSVYMEEAHSHDEQPKTQESNFADTVVNILATRVGELTKENAILMAKVIELQASNEV